MRYGNVRLHKDRGWCDFEKAASTTVKLGHCVLDFSLYKGATEFSGNGPADPNTFDNTCLKQMALASQARAPPLSPAVFGERMRARVASGELKFTAAADEEFVIGQYDKGFVAAIDRVAAKEDEDFRSLAFANLGWGDAEAAELLAALQYAAERCSFPHGSCGVAVTIGNHLSDEMIAKFEQLSGKFRIVS